MESLLPLVDFCGLKSTKFGSPSYVWHTHLEKNMSMTAQKFGYNFFFTIEIVSSMVLIEQ